MTQHTAPSDFGPVEDHPEQGQFHLQVAGQTAFIAYRVVDGAVMMTHTEVPESLEGQGVGSALVGGALDQLRERGQQLIPMCPFVAAYLQRHREYVDLVQPEQRGVFGL